MSGGENSTDSNFYKVHPRIKQYKNGVAQPGVLCVKPDATVIYQWAIEPSVVSASSDWGVVTVLLACFKTDFYSQSYNQQCGM